MNAELVGGDVLALATLADQRLGQDGGLLRARIQPTT
jgi:hypothetical protein